MTGGNGPERPLVSKKALGIAGAVALVAVIAVVAAVVLGGFGQPGGRPSAEQIAQDLTNVYSRVIEEHFDEDALDTMYRDFLNMMPPAVTDRMLDALGSDDISDLTELVGGQVPLDSIKGVADYLDKVNVESSFFVGNPIEQGDIDLINEAFRDANIDAEVTAGYDIGVDMQITVLEDVGNVSAGESQSMSEDDMGILAVEIDGRWYVWPDISSLVETYL